MNRWVAEGTERIIEELLCDPQHRCDRGMYKVGVAAWMQHAGYGGALGMWKCGNVERGDGVDENRAA